jgi:CheY-like chemotaxis protein
LNADPHRLAQVVSNLLDNAAKYTPRGGNEWLAAGTDGGDILLSVKDSGIGIPANRLDEVFQMFARIDRSAERTNAGLGIGLALVKSIVEMHGGSVEAHSDGPGRGTEVRVRLPAALCASPELPQPAVSPAPVDESPRRVLVVDDNQAAADLLCAVVEKLGNEVRVAYDGEEAIALAARFQPDVVLMDLGMPKLDGYGAARNIRKQPWGQQMRSSHSPAGDKTGTNREPARPASIITWSNPPIPPNCSVCWPSQGTAKHHAPVRHHGRARLRPCQ